MRMRLCLQTQMMMKCQMTTLANRFSRTIYLSSLAHRAQALKSAALGIYREDVAHM